MNKTILIWILLLAAALPVLPAAAQDAGGGGAAATEEKAAGGDNADLEQIFGDISVEELKQLVEIAAKRRLEVERKQVRSEIENNFLYEEDEAATKKALKRLTDKPANTQQDNLDRICQAMAIVDIRFAGPYGKFRAGKFAAAAEELAKKLNPEEATYLSAAMHYIYAEALRKSNKPWKAVDAYTNILVNMPERISFGSAAAMAAGEVYESMGRNMYAMEMYVYCLQNYSLTMPKQAAVDMLDKVEKFQKIYSNPLGAVSGMMKGIKKRLDDSDVGKGTRQKQQEVVALLEDLIKTAEEKQRNKKKQQQQQRQRQQRQEAQKKPGQKKPGQGKKVGKKPGPPQGKDPTTGAKDSFLVPGKVSKPSKLAKVHKGEDSSKWSDMPPRQREKIENIMRQRLAEKRGDQVREYHRKLAEGED
ncbi:MAG: hypothetical protein K8S55_16235 [Phycisphaerae bacterium]|nr:hypothetical protein [Phycisphaerae bacterium]